MDPISAFASKLLVLVGDRSRGSLVKSPPHIVFASRVQASNGLADDLWAAKNCKCVYMHLQ